MTLGERCDEIVRLIDETLAAVGATVIDGPHDEPAHGARRSPRAAKTPTPRAAQSDSLLAL